MYLILGGKVLKKRKLDADTKILHQIVFEAKNFELSAG